MQRDTRIKGIGPVDDGEVLEAAIVLLEEHFEDDPSTWMDRAITRIWRYNGEEKEAPPMQPK